MNPVSSAQDLLSLLRLSLLRFDASAQAVVLLERNAMSKTSAAVMNVAMAAYLPSFVEHILASLMDKYFPCSIDIGGMTIQWTVSPSQRQVNLVRNLLSHLLALESMLGVLVPLAVLPRASKQLPFSLAKIAQMARTVWL